MPYVWEVSVYSRRDREGLGWVGRYPEQRELQRLEIEKRKLELDHLLLDLERVVVSHLRHAFARRIFAVSLV